ncbi:MAG TPA: GAF domain-containing protein [Ktedonobacteraceae bacterium]
MMPHSNAVSQELPTWQAVLQKIIQSPRERQRLAAVLGINIITLSRWVKADSHPQRSYLLRLVKVVQPVHRSEMLNALLRSYPDMHDKFMEEITETVPSSFFRQILKDRASIIETLRPWQISGTVLNEALKLLDPHQLGMAVTAALCMPPVEGKIRSLREHGGRGNAPWSLDLEQKSVFLGLNSLAGHVVIFGRAASVPDVRKERYIPVFGHPADWEISAGAAPIWLQGRMAGCLLAASLQPEHFTQERMDLLGTFANIFSLALNPDEFYDHSMVHLRYVPLPDKQENSLKSFRQRVTRLMTESARQRQSLSNTEAEKSAWQEIEEELLVIGQQADDEQAQHHG